MEVVWGKTFNMTLVPVAHMDGGIHHSAVYVALGSLLIASLAACAYVGIIKGAAYCLGENHKRRHR